MTHFRKWHLLLSAAIALSAAAPASADYSVTAMRLDGEWETPSGKLVIKFGTFDGELVGDFFHHQYGRKYQLWWLEANSTLPSAERGRDIDAYLLVGNNSNVMPCRLFNTSCPSGRVRLTLSPDGNSLTLVRTDGAAIDNKATLTGRRLPGSPDVAARLALWVGEWQTSNGPVSLAVEGNVLLGTFGASGSVHPGRMAMIGNGLRVYGAWDTQASSPRQRGRVDFDMSANGQSFTGQQSFNRQADPAAPERPRPWNGEKGSAPPPPEPLPPAPHPPLPPVVTQPVPQPGPVVSSPFKPLRRVDVRLDRIVEARGYPTRQVHAFVTIRNASATPQYISSGYLRAVLTDADGVAQERNQVWRASGEPAALFSATPVVQPGAELKLRYVFNPDEGSRTATFALSEGDKRVEFQAGAL